MGRVLLLLLLTGCDVAFGLQRPPADAALEVDAAPDAPIDAACTVATRPVVIDGVLNQRIPTQPGTQPGLLNIQFTLNLKQVGIFKFEVTGDAKPTQLRLHLPHADHDGQCGTSCGACNLDHVGMFHAYAMTSSWDQQVSAANIGATWNCRRGPSGCLAGDRWEVAGATGTMDRSGELVTLTTAPPGSLDIPITDPTLVTLAWSYKGPTLPPPLDGGKVFLSFQLASADATGAYLARAFEHACDVGMPAASLDLVYCP